MTEIQRLNYFTGQFLIEDDFKAEQEYHLDMRRRHNRYLHTWGVADGLRVTDGGNKKIVIGPGTAIDKSGNEIVLRDPAPPEDLSKFGADKLVWVMLKYDQKPTDPRDGGNTRWTERPEIGTGTAQPATDGSVILLAAVKLNAGGNIESVDNDVRRLAGSTVSPSADIVARSLRIGSQLNFGQRQGAHVILWDPVSTVGVQKNTVYFRSYRNFSWYNGGNHADGELDAGGGQKTMSLSNKELTVAGGVTAESFSGKGSLTVSGDATLKKSLTVSGPMKIEGNNGSLTVTGDATLSKSLTVAGSVKINGNNTLEFGAGISGKEVSSGQIGYQAFAPKEALDIVGAGTAQGSRKIQFWAEGGATLHGSLTVTGRIVQEDWQVPKLEDSWETSNRIGGPRASFFKDSLGIVHFRGVIINKHNSEGPCIFKLPEGYRPATPAVYIVPAVGGNGFRHLEIQNEKVILKADKGDIDNLNEIYLDGVTFRAK